MDVHNVQKTGNMHYLYLPTAWCKKYGINNNTKITVISNNDESLTLYPLVVEKKKKKLNLIINETDPEIIHKLIVASYINPAHSFTITLNKELQLKTILQQKKLLGVELVEVSGKTISCESSISIQHPEALLKTMVVKIKNMLFIMQKKNFYLELVERYEEEIDKAKLYIDKAILSFFTSSEKYSLEPIEMHYISLISKDLEKMVDHLLLIDTTDKEFLRRIYAIIQNYHDILDKKILFTYETAIAFIKNVQQIKEIKVRKIPDYDKKIIKQYLVNISEVLIDWAITKEIEKK